MMQSTIAPGVNELMPALSKVFMLPLTIFTPAWPKPSASNVPNLIMVFSRIAVSTTTSSSSLASIDARKSQVKSPTFLIHSAVVLASSTLLLLVKALSILCFLASSSSKVLSAIFIASCGSKRMMFTLVIIRSMGANTKVFASAEKRIEATERTMQTKTVVRMPYCAPCLTNGRKSKKKAICQSSNCSLPRTLGLARNFSCGLRSLGHLIGASTKPSIFRLKSEKPK
mmetsp:Transcript_21797/g.74930  ORF Transcript_21797/g.74930 Transcript_21797/m.74930 type:complete len:227 (+) Transcript_21797:1192-1872(+)